MVAMRTRYGSMISGVCVAVLSTLPSAGRAADLIPPDSAMAKLQDQVQRTLISACEANEPVNKAALQISELAVRPAEAMVAPKVGLSALEFSGVAAGTDAKGDFTVPIGRPSSVRMLGIWIYLAPGANVKTLGLQVVDGEGEYLCMRIPADWEGWKWVEMDLSGKLEQAMSMPDKNGRFDQPLKSASVIWFTKRAGRTALAVDGLVAAADAEPGAAGVRLELAGNGAMEPGLPFSAPLIVTNLSAKPLSGTVEFSVQQDSSLYAGVAPDPRWGTDHARGAKSWTVADGKQIEEGSLTDGNEFTGAGTSYIGDHWAEAFQYIDLGTERNISHIRHSSGDANWCFKVDIAGSLDGQTYTPVQGLQGANWHAQWGADLDLATPEPFKARYVRFRYHDDGKKHEVIRMPVSISLYDGLADEKMLIPEVGAVSGSGRQQVEVPSRSFAVIPLDAGTMEPGAYFVGARLVNGEQAHVAYQHVFVMPPAMKLSPTSRFGMNAADISLAWMNYRLGVGWIRFENAKWPFVTAKPGEYAFDGSVAPWHVNLDEIIAKYKAMGMSFLPTMFMTPGYLATEKAPTVEPSVYPPSDLSAYGEFTFQTVARYAGKSHPADVLKTADKKSGLGLVSIYELWNEPDLNNMDWGSWRAPYEKYLEMFRFGAEGVKRADPDALISSCGLSDYRLATVDKFRTYKYADGKTPLDYIDILNVHHYTGRVAPEIATMDINVNRDDDAKKGKHTYEEELQILDKWRKQYKPGMPIWLSEMGYDTGGPVAVTERTQAAYIVRNTMIALANGVEKVFLFRESGSGSNLFWGSGVVRTDHSFKPSWFTLATLIRQLDGVTEGRRLLCADRNTWLYEWRRGEETVLSAWTVAGEGKLDLDLGRCSVTDAFGRSRTAVVEGAVPLSIFPVYISGIANPAGLEALRAQSSREEQIDRDEVARLGRLQAYLFDFGSREFVGSFEVGSDRPCTPVLAQDAWGPDKSYGFEPASGQSEVGGGSHENTLECDWVRLGAENKFRLRAKPGRYQLRISAAPLQPDLQATVTGIKGESRTVAVDPSSLLGEAEIEVGEEPITIQFNKYLLLRWLTLVEVDTKADSPRH